MFSADVETKSYTLAMRVIGKTAVPRAVATALNATAEAVTKQAIRNVRRKLIVRTQFTLRSIRQLRTARGTNLKTMHSRSGSISPYLAIQDEGGTIRASKQKIPLPTLQARTGRSIQRRIASRYRMNRLGGFGKGSKFFITRSRRGRWGIYERMARRIRMIRSLEEPSVRVPGVQWFSDAVGRFGTRQFINAQYIKAARNELRRAGVTKP